MFIKAFRFLQIYLIKPLSVCYEFSDTVFIYINRNQEKKELTKRIVLNAKLSYAGLSITAHSFSNAAFSIRLT